MRRDRTRFSRHRIGPEPPPVTRPDDVAHLLSVKRPAEVDRAETLRRILRRVECAGLRRIERLDPCPSETTKGFPPPKPPFEFRRSADKPVAVPATTQSAEFFCNDPTHWPTRVRLNIGQPFADLLHRHVRAAHFLSKRDRIHKPIPNAEAREEISECFRQTRPHPLPTGPSLLILLPIHQPRHIDTLCVTRMEKRKNPLLPRAPWAH